MDIFKKRFSKKSLWYIFSVCAFPVHVWTLILFFRDYSWIAERTNQWDAIGVGAYGLTIAFVESLLLFIIASALRFIMPATWAEEKWVTLLGSIILLTLVWTIVGQLYFLINISMPSWFLRLFASIAHPLWFLYATIALMVGISIVIWTYFLYVSKRFRSGVYQFFDRIAVLTSIYLFLDLCSFIIVLVRNLP